MIRSSYYITAPELMELIFAVLYVSRTMGLKRCYKTAVCYIYICNFPTKWCYFCSRISSLTLCKCPCIVSALQIAKLTNFSQTTPPREVVISIFRWQQWRRRKSGTSCRRQSRYCRHCIIIHWSALKTELHVLPILWWCTSPATATLTVTRHIQRPWSFC